MSGGGGSSGLPAAVERQQPTSSSSSSSLAQAPSCASGSSHGMPWRVPSLSQAVLISLSSRHPSHTCPCRRAALGGSPAAARAVANRRRRRRRTRNSAVKTESLFERLGFCRRAVADAAGPPPARSRLRHAPWGGRAAASPVASPGSLAGESVRAGDGARSNSKEKASSMSRVPARSTEKTRSAVQSVRGGPPGAGSVHAMLAAPPSAWLVSGSGRMSQVSGSG